MKVCVITCYRQPDYVRAVAMRQLVSQINGVNQYNVINSTTSILRYPEVLFKVLFTRVKYNPETYVLTFRGYEILPAIRLMTVGKKLIYDEFINPIEWLVYEHGLFSRNSVLVKLLVSMYKFWANSADKILADTVSHLNLSSKILKIDPKKFSVIEVGTDEKLFDKNRYVKKKKNSSKFRVFYYGSMLPLHGVDIVIEAAKILKKNDNIEFYIVGGNSDVQKAIGLANSHKANIKYSRRIPYNQIPQEAIDADLCLGGPFGGTTQAQHVITGKTFQFLSLGAPVLVGQNSSHAKFKDKKNCLYVKQANPKILAAKVNWAFINRAKLKKIGSHGHELYENNYSSKILATKLAGLL